MQVDPEALDDVVIAIGPSARALAAVGDLGTVDHDLGLAGARAGLGRLKSELSRLARHELHVLDRSRLRGREMAAVLEGGDGHPGAGRPVPDSGALIARLAVLRIGGLALAGQLGPEECRSRRGSRTSR